MRPLPLLLRSGIGQWCGWVGRFAVTPWSADAENPRQQFEVATDAIHQDLGYYEKYAVTAGPSDTVAFMAINGWGKSTKRIIGNAQGFHFGVGSLSLA